MEKRSPYEPANETRVLVVGYGNPGRQDDALGPAAAEAVERLGLPGVRVSVAYQLAIEDAYDAASCDAVLFVDASTCAPEPFSVDAVVPSPEVACFASHVVRPEFIVGLCRTLYGRAPAATLIGIRGYAFAFGEGLTQRARVNLDLAVSYIHEVLREHVGAA